MYDICCKVTVKSFSNKISKYETDGSESVVPFISSALGYIGVT